MLSRVIMQQAYPQLGIDPVASNCVGLSGKQIEQLDFHKIDLTEWINDAVQYVVPINIQNSPKNQLWKTYHSRMRTINFHQNVPRKQWAVKKI